jgi:hypothetical protein
MNIGIGNNRWVKFSRTITRAGDGEWRGRGHGYRFRVGRTGMQWCCTVWRDGGAVITSCTSHKMKAAIQEGTRLADTETSCPT